MTTLSSPHHGSATRRSGRSGELETAVEEFARLLNFNPGYAAGYFHGGQTLEKLGRAEEAREKHQITDGL